MKKNVVSLLLASIILSSSLLHAADPHQSSRHHASKTQVASRLPSPDDQAPSAGWAIVQKLMEGNHRFVHGKSTHPHQTSAHRGLLSTGQNPHTIVLSCSDSRVPPEVVFDQGLGDLFTVRTAGHVAEASAVASIEYAVEHLGAKVLLVMGHTSCGAVKATLSTPLGKSAGSPNLDHLVKMIRPHVARFASHPLDKDLAEPVRANVDGTLQGLLIKSPIIREAVEAGHLMLVQGMYHLDTGKVDVWL